MNTRRPGGDSRGASPSAKIPTEKLRLADGVVGALQRTDISSRYRVCVIINLPSCFTSASEGTKCLLAADAMLTDSELHDKRETRNARWMLNVRERF